MTNYGDKSLLDNVSTKNKIKLKLKIKSFSDLPTLFFFAKEAGNRNIFCFGLIGAVVVEWLSSWFAEQEIRGSIPGLPTSTSEIGYLMLPNRDMAEIPLNKRRISSIQPTNQLSTIIIHMTKLKLNSISVPCGLLQQHVRMHVELDPQLEPVGHGAGVLSVYPVTHVQPQVLPLTALVLQAKVVLLYDSKQVTYLVEGKKIYICTCFHGVFNLI